jgi:acetyltransferase-like isoleucine patch superfamily enzyme
MTGLSTSPGKGDGDGRKTVIGHDVWIGCNSVVLSGVTIGTGAVIGAGSVVTKDIPPYAIAYGNPAKVHRYRFDPETIDALLKSEWWRFSMEQLKTLPLNKPLQCIKRMGKP